MSRLVIKRVHTDVKNTYNINIMVFFPDYYKSVFIDGVPYKHKNWQLHGILIIPVQISLFSPHMQKVDCSA